MKRLIGIAALSVTCAWLLGAQTINPPSGSLRVTKMPPGGGLVTLSFSTDGDTVSKFPDLPDGLCSGTITVMITRDTVFTLVLQGKGGQTVYTASTATGTSAVVCRTRNSRVDMLFLGTIRIRSTRRRESSLIYQHKRTSKLKSSTRSGSLSLLLPIRSSLRAGGSSILWVTTYARAPISHA